VLFEFYAIGQRGEESGSMVNRGQKEEKRKEAFDWFNEQKQLIYNDSCSPPTQSRIYIHVLGLSKGIFYCCYTKKYTYDTPVPMILM
jgi:hypothetical protein